MKIILTFFSLLFAASLFSQDTSRAGSLYLGLNTNLIHQSPIYASVDPFVTYFLSDTWTIGGKFDYQHEEDETTGENVTRSKFIVLAQKYITDNAFLGAMYSSDFEGTNSLGLSVGYTAFLGSRFYLEPSYLVRVEDNNYYGAFQVSCGIKLKD